MCNYKSRAKEDLEPWENIHPSLGETSHLLLQMQPRGAEAVRFFTKLIPECGLHLISSFSEWCFTFFPFIGIVIFPWKSIYCLHCSSFGPPDAFLGCLSPPSSFTLFELFRCGFMLGLIWISCLRSACLFLCSIS